LKILKLLETILLYRDDEGEGNVQCAMNKSSQRDKENGLAKVNGKHVQEILGLLGCEERIQ